MKKGRGKPKGNKYEIIISRILSEWFYKNKPYKQKGMKKHDYFWRTAGSGAKATVTKRGESSFVGDIAFLPNPDRLQIWIDTKDRKTATFNSILADKFIIEEWYIEEKVKRDTLGIKKPVVIIFKLYRKKEDYVFFDSYAFEKTTISSMLDNMKHLKRNDKKLVIYKNHFWITTLDILLEYMPEEGILKERE